MKNKIIFLSILWTSLASFQVLSEEGATRHPSTLNIREGHVQEMIERFGGKKEAPKPKIEEPVVVPPVTVTVEPIITEVKVEGKEPAITDVNKEQNEEKEQIEHKKPKKHKNKKRPTTKHERKERKKKLKKMTEEEIKKIADAIYFLDYGKTDLDNDQIETLRNARIALRLQKKKNDGIITRMFDKIKDKIKEQKEFEGSDNISEEKELKGVALSKISEHVYIDKKISFKLLNLILNHIQENYHENEIVLYKITAKDIFVSVENNETINIMVREDHKAVKITDREKFEVEVQKDNKQMIKIIELFQKKMKKNLNEHDMKKFEKMIKKLS